MRIDEEDFGEAVRLALANPVNSLIYADDSVAVESVAALQRLGVPDELSQFLRNWALRRSLVIGCVDYDGIETIRESNEGEFGCVHSGLIKIGDAANGDWLVVDGESGSTGFLGHEDLAEPDARKRFISAAPSLGGYYLRHVKDPDWASDYYELRASRRK